MSFHTNMPTGHYIRKPRVPWKLRFYSYIEINPNGCWNWFGSVDGKDMEK